MAHKNALQGGKGMFYVIVNPGSGSGRGYYTWKKLEEGFVVAGLKYQVATTKKAGDARRLTTSLIEKHKDEEGPITLIVIGGDGTMNEVINGITDFDKIRLGYIPGGSAGDLALGLGLKVDTSELIRRIKTLLPYLDFWQKVLLHTECSSIRHLLTLH